jgi:hypothetical protein
MRNIIFIFIIFPILISCNKKAHKPHKNIISALDSLLKRHENCLLNGESKNFDTSKYSSVWNAAYAYDYVYPTNFKDVSIEILDKDGTIISDTSALLSPDKNAILKFWIGETIPMPQVNINTNDILIVDRKIDSLIVELNKSKYNYLSKFSVDTLCHAVHGYYHNISLIGSNNKQIIIYKIEYSVLPVSGDLIAKNLVFVYNKKFANIYHPIGITIANNFGFARH